MSNPKVSKDTPLECRIAMFAGALLLASPFFSQGILKLLPMTAGAAFMLGGANAAREEDEDSIPAFLMGGLRPATKEAQKTAAAIALETLPPPIQEAWKAMPQVEADYHTTWRKLHEQSLGVIAQTDGGKTHILHQSMAYVIAQGWDLYAVVKGFGKRSHKFHNLPFGKVLFHFSDTDIEKMQSLPNLVSSLYNLRNERATKTREGQDSTFKPTFLYITEYNRCLENYAERWKPDCGYASPAQIKYWLDEILFDGHGYQCFIVIEAQTLAVSETGIKEATRAQMNFILAGSTAVNVKELSKLGSNFSDLVPKVTALRRVPGKGRAAIAVLKMNPCLFIPAEGMPTVDVSKAYDQGSDIDRWWSAQGSAAVADWQATNPSGSASKCFEAIRDIVPSGKRSKSSGNPYWEKVKAEFQPQTIEVSV